MAYYHLSVYTLHYSRNIFLRVADAQNFCRNKFVEHWNLQRTCNVANRHCNQFSMGMQIFISRKVSIGKKGLLMAIGMGNDEEFSALKIHIKLKSAAYTKCRRLSSLIVIFFVNNVRYINKKFLIL